MYCSKKKQQEPIPTNILAPKIGLGSSCSVETRHFSEHFLMLQRKCMDYAT